ncbi:Probable ubiquitin-conjugating enzyme protein 17 [Galdieria sulphuraria]|nr:Probable ubiquitin-conjugating enzyme protein 17 [Galdieria sulphuraria]
MDVGSDDSDVEIVSVKSHRKQTQKGESYQCKLNFQGTSCDNYDSGNLLNNFNCPLQLCLQKLATRDCLKLFIHLFSLGEHKTWLQYWDEEIEKLGKLEKRDSRSGLVSLSSNLTISQPKLCYCGYSVDACAVEWSAEPSTLLSLARFHCGLARILSINLQIERITTTLRKKVPRLILQKDSAFTSKKSLRCSKRITRYYSSGVGFGGSSHEKFSENESHKRKSDYDDSLISSVFDCLVIVLDRRLGPYPLFLWSFLHHSVLSQIVANLLRNNSVYDVCSRMDLYMSLFYFLRLLAEDFTLQLFLFIPISCTYDYNGSEKESANVCLAELLGEFERSTFLALKYSSSIWLLRLVLETEVSIPKSERSDKDLSLEYCNRLKDLQFQTLEGLSRVHSITNKSNMRKEWNASKGRTFRLAKEISSLRNDLPLFYGSSIIVRVDEENFDVFRVLIFGPEEYPEKPPVGRFLNTRRGEIRCNPNLYNCGKICLSLLGTWPGPSWSSQCTLLQVLVSIQSFIFVGEPYFNEPGFEEFQSTIRGKRKSRTYNLYVEDYTVKYAMLDVLKKPYKGFEQVLKEHFRLKQRQVIRQVEEWQQKANERTMSPSHDNVFSEFTDSSSVSRITCGVQMDTLKKLKETLEQL